MEGINYKKLHKQLQKALNTQVGFTHTGLNGKKYRITMKDVKIFKNKYDSKLEKKQKQGKEYEGGFLPLIPLFAGLSALGALSGGAAGIASAVNNANHNAEMEKIANEKGVTVSTGSGMKRKKQKNVDNIPTLYPDFDLIAEEIKKPSNKKTKKGGSIDDSVQGSSLFLNPYQGKGIKDFIKGIVKNSNVEEIGKKAVIDVLKNIAIHGANIKVEGGALFLNPYH